MSKAIRALGCSSIAMSIVLSSSACPAFAGQSQTAITASILAEASKSDHQRGIDLFEGIFLGVGQDVERLRVLIDRKDYDNFVAMNATSPPAHLESVRSILREEAEIDFAAFYADLTSGDVFRVEDSLNSAQVKVNAALAIDPSSGSTASALNEDASGTCVTVWAAVTAVAIAAAVAVEYGAVVNAAVMVNVGFAVNAATNVNVKFWNSRGHDDRSGYHEDIARLTTGLSNF